MGIYCNIQTETVVTCNRDSQVGQLEHQVEPTDILKVDLCDTQSSGLREELAD